MWLNIQQESTWESRQAQVPDTLVDLENCDLILPYTNMVLLRFGTNFNISFFSTSNCKNINILT